MNEILNISHLSKKFNFNYALKDISLCLNSGEILGLVGANGSGKTTLMNILAGNPVIKETGGFTGNIKLGGSDFSPSSTSESIRNGVGMVYQEFALIPSFTAAENIMLGRENRIRPFRFLPSFHIPVIDKKKDRETAAGILAGISRQKIDPDTAVSEMSVSIRQFIEFARVINSARLKLLILDEPTAVLGTEESLKLIEGIRALADTGTAVIFISHRLEEVLSLCSRVAILRDGVLTRTFNSSETDAETVALEMLGIRSRRAYKKAAVKNIKRIPFFRIHNLNCSRGGERLNSFSLEAERGEIIGITGQSGQGQMLIGKALMGLIPNSGEVIIDENIIPPGDISKLFDSGFCYIPEERRKNGLLPEHSIAENIAFTLISLKKKFSSGSGFLKPSKIDENARLYIRDLDIRCTGPHQKAGELSGGNQQKVILARAISLDPDIMMINEPTRGIDIGAKEVILHMLLKMNSENKMTILIVSSELDELRRVCDRIAIVYEGSIFKILDPGSSDEEYALAFTGRNSA